MTTTSPSLSSPAHASKNPSTETNALPREWLRIKEACEFSRVSKPKLYDLINRGLVKSFSLKERGQIKGTRLVSFDSLRDFLRSRMTGGESSATTGTAPESE